MLQESLSISNLNNLIVLSYFLNSSDLFELFTCLDIFFLLIAIKRLITYFLMNFLMFNN